jgi:GNAT superfamily N-acetyltransferase
MSVLIRLAEVSDAEAVASLVRGYWEFEDIPGFDRQRITSLLADYLTQPQRGHCWVAEIDGALAGYLLAVYLFSLEHGGLMAEIDEFFVVPEKRSLKIGAALLEAATVAMAQRGITHVQLQLGCNNSHGQRFYQRLGFEALSGYALLHKSLQR